MAALFDLLVLASVFLLSFGMGLLLVALLGCSTVPEPKPTPGPITDTTTGSPCTDVGLTYCAKVEVCGAGSYSECAASIVAGCMTVTGITPEEALDCSLAILEARCDAKMPEVCIGIAVNDDRVPKPGLSL